MVKQGRNSSKRKSAERFVLRRLGNTRNTGAKKPREITRLSPSRGKTGKGVFQGGRDSTTKGRDNKGRLAITARKKGKASRNIPKRITESPQREKEGKWSYEEKGDINTGSSSTSDIRTSVRCGSN